MEIRIASSSGRPQFNYALHKNYMKKWLLAFSGLSDAHWKPFSHLTVIFAFENRKKKANKQTKNKTHHYYTSQSIKNGGHNSIWNFLTFSRYFAKIGFIFNIYLLWFGKWKLHKLIDIQLLLHGLCPECSQYCIDSIYISRESVTLILHALYVGCCHGKKKCVFFFSRQCLNGF